MMNTGKWLKNEFSIGMGLLDRWHYALTAHLDKSDSSFSSNQQPSGVCRFPSKNLRHSSRRLSKRRQ